LRSLGGRFYKVHPEVAVAEREVECGGENSLQEEVTDTRLAS
jgi:hypothetical protein